MSNDKQVIKFDLEERTAKFREEVIIFCKQVAFSNIVNSLINQLIRSATSIGSNYCEADCAESKKDFIHKLAISKKEAKETKHWLRMISKALPEQKDKIRKLWQEARELNLILIAIINKTKNN